MNDLDPALLLLGGLGGLAVVLLFTAALVHRARERTRARRRVVEKPNSHYTSQAVQDTRARHRWQGIPLERVHEINRGEVVRLLAKVEASGMEALKPGERAFLDQIAVIAPPPPETRPRDTAGPVPQLRERPA